MAHGSIVARATELAEYRGYLDVPGAVVVITGVHDTGRTRLATMLLGEVRTAGVPAVLITATQPELEPAIGVWTRPAVAAARAAIETPAALLAPFPAATDTAPIATTDPQLDAASLTLLDHLAVGDGRTVVVIDDVHRADTATLQLLARLTPSLTGHRCCWY